MNDYQTNSSKIPNQEHKREPITCKIVHLEYLPVITGHGFKLLYCHPENMRDVQYCEQVSLKYFVEHCQLLYILSGIHIVN